MFWRRKPNDDAASTLAYLVGRRTENCMMVAYAWDAFDYSASPEGYQVQRDMINRLFEIAEVKRAVIDAEMRDIRE
jgi:hypothetical protein